MQKLATMLAEHAPALAALMDGGASATVLAVLGRVFLDDDEATVDEVAAAIAKDQDRAPKLKRAEAEIALRVPPTTGPATDTGGGGIQQKTADAAPAPSAGRLNDWTISILAFVVTAGFFAVLAALLFCKGDCANSGVINTLLGMLGTGWAGIIAFYYGSSVGSKEKNAIISRQNAGDRGP